MAGERTLPGLGLRAYWTAGSNGWGTQHDPDTRKVSVLCQLVVASRVAVVPGSPTQGDVHILTGAPNQYAVAAYDNAAWVYFVPAEGWTAYDQATNEVLFFTGAAWAVRQALPAFSASNARQKLRVNSSGLLAWSYDPIGIRSVTASTTLVAADASAYVRLADASALVLTVPLNASVPFEIGTLVNIRQGGAGQVTVSGAVGVTLNTPETSRLRKLHSSAALIKVGTDEWDFTGDLELAP
jgi:hypothetical protein